MKNINFLSMLRLVLGFETYDVVSSDNARV